METKAKAFTVHRIGQDDRFDISRNQDYFKEIYSITTKPQKKVEYLASLFGSEILKTQ